MSDPRTKLEIRIGHTFRDRELLERALTHQSYLADHPTTVESNQRLEFLGDAVLQILIAEALFQLFPSDREGSLSRRRSMLVNGAFLAQLAREVDLERLLRLGASEENTGGRMRPSILGDAFEALIGAIYLDAGLDPARVIVRAIYGDLLARLLGIEEMDNPKGRLQERVQPLHGNDALRYDVVRTDGEDHARTYEVAVHLLDRHLGTGSGTSKKLAEEAAARMALTVLNQD